jgi:hypothetical protein
MQFFSSSQFPWVNSKLPQAVPTRHMLGATSSPKIDCGWYDSSFDLSRGLEVSEQDNDTLYQLWELSQN